MTLYMTGCGRQCARLVLGVPSPPPTTTIPRHYGGTALLKGHTRYKPF